MNEERRKYLLKLIRGKDFRRAVRAIAELASHEPDEARSIATPARADEQRIFQTHVAQVVLQNGIAGLVDGWAALGEAKWRAVLVEEMGQFLLHLGACPAFIEIGLRALEDPSREVQIKAVWMLQLVKEPDNPKGRRLEPGTFDHAAQELRGLITPAQRLRMTRALTAILERHRVDPYPVRSQVVDLLGFTANAQDRTTIDLLEALRTTAGETHRVSYERAGRDKYEWFEKLVMAKKKIFPKEIVRIKYTPTGLLDKELLEQSLARIKRRMP